MELPWLGAWNNTSLGNSLLKHKILLRPAQLDPALIGHPLPWDLYTESGVLVAGAGLVIANETDFLRLSARPLYQQSKSAQIGDSPLDLLEELAARAEALLYEPAENVPVPLYELVDGLLELARADADACLGFTRLTPLARPALRHSLLVLLVAQRLARYLEFSAAETFSLAGAALTMNLADLEAHDRALADDMPALALASAGLAEHPTRAAESLRRIGVDDPAWLDCVLQHHEGMDGGGFPAGLAGGEIGLPARILRVADSYCLRVSGRYYQPPRHRRHAMQEIFGVELSHLDTQIATLLLRLWGTRPPGTLLRLSNRESACVARGGPGGQARFGVSFLDARSRPLEPPRERNLENRFFAPRAFLHVDPAWPPIAWKQIWGY